MSSQSPPPEPLPRALWLAAVPLTLYYVVPLAALLLLLSPVDLVRHLTSPLALHALALTLKTTTVATLLAIALGTPLAYLLARGQFRGHQLLDTLVDLPIALPPVVAGVALLLAFAPSEVALAPERWPGSAQNVFAGHVIEVLALGDRVRVVLDVGVVLVAEVTREAAAGLAIRVGRRLFAAVKATAIRVYA